VLAEATRLAVSQAAVGRVVKAMLMKAMFLQCEASGVDCMVVTARHPMESLLRWTAVRGHLPGKRLHAHGSCRHDSASGDGLRLVATKRKWLEIGHPWYSLFFDTRTRTLRWRFPPILAPVSAVAATRKRFRPCQGAERILRACCEVPQSIAGGKRLNESTDAAPVAADLKRAAPRFSASQHPLAGPAFLLRHSARSRPASCCWRCSPGNRIPPVTTPANLQLQRRWPLFPDDGQIEPAAAREALRGVKPGTSFDTQLVGSAGLVRLHSAGAGIRHGGPAAGVSSRRAMRAHSPAGAARL
jgi:hypothetical protein